MTSKGRLVRSELLKQLLKRDPCPRLRLHLSNGTTFEIADRDLVVVTKWTVEFLHPTDGPHMREVVVNLLHIIWIEILPPN